MKIMCSLQTLFLFLFLLGCNKQSKINGYDYMAMSAALSEVNMFDFERWPPDEGELLYIEHYKIIYVDDYRGNKELRPIIVDELTGEKGRTIVFMCSEGTFRVLNEDLPKSLKKVQAGDFEGLREFKIDP